jgi:hypothetical protein
VSGPVAEVDEGGQQSVGEHQSVLRTSAHGPLPWPGRKPRLMPFMPQRAYLRDEFITPADRPVILRLLMIATRVVVPTTRP